MTEDEIYRASTQYRLWSFTPESLRAQRCRTNALAAEGVRAAIRDLSSARAITDTQADESKANSSADHPELVDCLSVEEEQKLVGYYCGQAIKVADFCEFPSNVKVILVMLRTISDNLLTPDGHGRLQQFNILNAFTCPILP